MAKYLISLLFLFVSVFLTISNANDKKVHPIDPDRFSREPVCDSERFYLLGLNMSDFAYCDKSLPFEVRAKDLIDRMTLDEKAKQLGNTAQGVHRIGLPRYEWWSEALHGVSDVGPGTFFDEVVPYATSFPTIILSTAAFNSTLWKTIGEAVSTEARAMYNLGKAGLTFWSPTMNLVRDPRWGRTTETPGEDPFTIGVFASNYVRGLQDVQGSKFNSTDLNSRPLKVSACCKHFAAYDVDNWLGVDRLHFNAKVTEQDMAETFLRPFEMCVKDGDVSSVMCSYNRVNGFPTCADPSLLKGILRKDWDLHGYIVSDCDSIEVMVDRHKWLHQSNEDAVSQVLKAGLDLDCGAVYPNSLANAVRQGKVKESQIDKALKNLYVVLLRLGFFDGKTGYEKLGKKDICTDEHMELAAEAAREGIVLLKNDHDILPLNPKNISHIALIGPHANVKDDMLGNYAGIPCRKISPLDAISGIIKNVTYEIGCDVKCSNDTGFFKAVRAAATADVTLLFVGSALSIEAESRDRVDLVLPGQQNTLINQIAEASKGPVILVVLSAGGFDISNAKKHSNIKSIVWAGFPGQEGGKAISDVIFGNYTPGGRLPITWYESDYINKLPMTSMPLRPIDSLGYPGRTYKFYNGSTVFPFGYGLSYTKFSYELVTSTKSLTMEMNKRQLCRNVTYEKGVSSPPCPSAVVDELKCSKDQIKFQVSVRNVGKRDGSEVVLVYSVPPKGIVGTHIKQLIGFQRVFVKAGSSEKVNFEFDPCKTLNIVDDSGYNLVPHGTHKILVGDGIVSDDIVVTLKKN